MNVFGAWQSARVHLGPAKSDQPMTLMLAYQHLGTANPNSQYKGYVLEWQLTKRA